MTERPSSSSPRLDSGWLEDPTPLVVTQRLAILVREVALHHANNTTEDLLDLLRRAYAEAYAHPSTVLAALDELRDLWRPRVDEIDHGEALVLVCVLGRPVRLASLVVLDASTVWRLTDRCVMVLLPVFAADVLERDVGWFHVSARVPPPSSPTETALLAAMLQNDDPGPTELLERLPLVAPAARALCR